MRATRSTSTLLAVTGVLVLILGALTANAQPPNTPIWWGLDDDRATNVTVPFNNDGDRPTPSVTPDPNNPLPRVEEEGDARWIDNVAGHQGVMGVQGVGEVGKVTIWVWNGSADNSEKHLWVQFDCYVQNGGVMGPSAKAGHPPGSIEFQNPPPPAEDIGGGWTRHWREWKIKPQPAWEEITFTMATADVPGGGTAVIDNVKIGTHCTNEDPKGKVAAFNMALPGPPEPVYVSAPPGCQATVFSIHGSHPPEWMPELAGHEGVIGLPGGFLADGILELWVDDLAEPEGLKHIACQFDFYVAEGGEIMWETELPPECDVENYQEYINDLENGWQRCVIMFDASPPPDWELFRWFMHTDPGSGPVAVDSIIVSSGFLFQDDWSEDFDFYMPGTDLHGQYGWKGWDNDHAFTAFTADVQALSPFNSLEVAGDTDLVHEFDYLDTGRWQFSAWQYIPGDFSSNGTGQFAGSYIVMMNTYADGGPHEEDDWSLQMNFDSNDGMLKVYHGNGLNTVNVPYVPDEWVEIQVIIDLDDDWTHVYYDNDLVTEYSWTGGVLGGGSGAFDIAAVDLYANGSSPVFYDDLRLRLAIPGDLDDDGDVDFDDIDPFVLALGGQAGYEEAYPYGIWLNADADGNGIVDFDDIDPFVALLSGG